MVLIFTLDPIAINKHTVITDQVSYRGFIPSNRQRHCTSTSFNSFKIVSNSFPNT